MNDEPQDDGDDPIPGIGQMTALHPDATEFYERFGIAHSATTPPYPTITVG